MFKSLQCLLRTPQNNLRIFKDGTLVWGDDNKDAEILKDLAEYFPKNMSKKVCNNEHIESKSFNFVIFRNKSVLV